ncbi:Ribosome maturation protein SDO1 [uncultured archaeon]|nr:Ribosome maturation protein SDO1 [uncultured archaeon]
MVSLDKSIIAHIKVQGKQFEIYVDPDAGLAYRQGQKKELNNVLPVEEIFTDAKASERAKSSDLQKAFGTQDVFAIAERILKEGELALTTEQKRKMMELKRKQIAQLISREATDPRTGAPHPLVRIEAAMDKVRLDIDPMQDAAAQMDKVISALRIELPIKMEKKRIAIKVPAVHAHRAYGLLKGQHMEKEEWGSDGSLMGVITIPAGMVGEFLDKLNKATSGDNQTKML